MTVTDGLMDGWVWCMIYVQFMLVQNVHVHDVHVRRPAARSFYVRSFVRLFLRSFLRSFVPSFVHARELPRHHSPRTHTDDGLTDLTDSSLLRNNFNTPASRDAATACGKLRTW